jgi:tRNA threonylcarbamoyladenosine modification (KEOPS) complex  Pcc1 subunit
MHTLHLTITGPRRHIIRQVLEQETVPRAGSTITEQDTAVNLIVTADSAAHLRAAANSFLRWIDLVDRIGDALGFPDETPAPAQ